MAISMPSTAQPAQPAEASLFCLGRRVQAGGPLEGRDGKESKEGKAAGDAGSRDSSGRRARLFRQAADCFQKAASANTLDIDADAQMLVCTTLALDEDGRWLEADTVAVD